MEQFFVNIATQLGLAGVLVISFIGASSILFPIPYHPLIFLIGVSSNNPLLVVALAGVGSATGELTGYILGYATKNVVGEKRKRRFDAMLKLLMRHKRIWPLLIFLFALTPLPDDLLFIPLGLVHFNFLRAFIPCIIGKVMWFSIIVFGGKYFGSIIVTLLGGHIESSMFFVILTVIAFVVMVVGMWKIDFEKLLTKYMKI